MTDNDIIKALECCLKTETLADCLKIECPYIEEFGCVCGGERGLLKKIRALINCQKSEIERLNKEVDRLSQRVKEYIDLAKHTN